MMKLELEIAGALCWAEVFRINGIEADAEEFGEKYDASPSSAEDYSCGDMRFFPSLPTDEILNKFSITLSDYNIICEKLDGLSFGCCGWCS